MVHFMLTEKSDVSLQKGLISIASSVFFALILMQSVLMHFNFQFALLYKQIQTIDNCAMFNQ